MESREKIKFFVKNLIRGLIWLSLLVTVYLLLKNSLGIKYDQWLSPLYNQPGWVYFVYSLSELLFGIIPPELFMIWGLRSGEVGEYVLIVFLLASISYLAGIFGFYLGVYLSRTWLFSQLKQRVFGKYEVYFTRFGAFLIVVAALTPIPFSGISMLVGSVCFPVKRYLLFALTRFLRFAAYSLIIWKANLW